MNNFSRRALLQLALAASCSALVPGLPMASSEILRRRPIPSSGELLPVVGLGTWQTFNLTNRSASSAVLERFVQLGGTLVDSSPMYGQAEEAIGTIGQELDVLDQLFLATKVWTRGEEAGIRQMMQSGRLMGRTPLDLIQIHNLQDWRTHLKTLKAMKENGEVRYIGVTHYTESAHGELERIVRSEAVDFVQVNLNIAAPNAETSLLPAAADHGVGVIVNRPYGEGALFRVVNGRELPGWAAEIDCNSFGQLFLKYILSNDAVTCVIPATSKVRHLEDNMGAGMGHLPDAAQRRRMREWFSGL